MKYDATRLAWAIFAGTTFLIPGFARWATPTPPTRESRLAYYAARFHAALTVFHFTFLRRALRFDRLWWAWAFSRIHFRKLSGNLLGSSDFNPTFTGLVGKPFVTVGNPGSGATYQSTDGTAFAAALAAGKNAIVVLDGTTISPTKTMLLTGTGGGDIFFMGSANISVLSGSQFVKTPNHAGGTATWCNIFGTGGASDWDVWGLSIVCTLTSVATVGCTIGGNSNRIYFHNYRCTGVDRYARHVAAYIEAPLGTAYDGPVDDIQWFNPSSDSCGDTTVPDGGGMKYFNGASAATSNITNGIEWEPRDTNVGFACFDVNWNGATATGPNPGGSGIRRYGGSGSLSAAANSASVGTMVFIESSNAVSPNDDIQIIGGSYDGTAIAGQQGVYIGGTSRNVKLVGVAVKNCATGYVWQAATGQVSVGGGWVVEAGSARACTTAMQVNFVAGAGTNGSTWGPCLVTGFRADDYSTGTMTTGLLLSNLSVAKLMVGWGFVACDFSRVASGGTVYSATASSGSFMPGTYFSNVVGMTDQGKIANPYGGATKFDIRNNGTLAKPADASTNTYQVRMSNCTLASSAGSGLSMTAKTAAGNTLAPFGATSGTSATVVASLDYCTDAAGTLTVAIGSSVGLSLTVTYPDGRQLVNASTAALAATAIPAGSVINFGAFTVAAPTVTWSGSATPAGPAISAVATFTTTSFPYNSSLQFVTNTTSGTFVVTPAAATTAFYAYRSLSLFETGASGAASTSYDVEGVSVMYNGSSMVAFGVNDGANVATTQVSTTAYYGRIPRGHRLLSTTVGTQIVFVDNA